MAVLEPPVTAFVNRVMFQECAHSAADNEGFSSETRLEGFAAEPITALVYREPVKNCIECLTREATKFAAHMIAVGRQLEREEPKL